MRTIWKYPLDPNFSGECEINAHEDFTILKFGVQAHKIHVWALVNPSNDYTKLKCKIFGTGHDIPDDLDERYIFGDTVFDGAFVWHIFIEK